MNPIQALPNDVVEKIAAGEVIERPANLVKELIENSVDALATEIEIDFDSGGKRISVSDNGYGISKSDISLSLQRFATSKIKTSDDLWQLQTYGFRGEALASVAAVSSLTLTSKRRDSTSAARISAQFGVVSAPVEISGDFGTTVVIENLFENVPARLKFLKSDSAESSQIKKVIRAMALSRPDIGFKIKSGGRLIEYWPKTKSSEERAGQVLGLSLFHSTETFGMTSIRVSFSTPLQVQKTSQNIWIFVQGRWVQDRTIQSAILDAYRSLLMNGEYPSVVIQLEVNPAEVDVNIHPTKAQVKFISPSQIFRTVQNFLRRELEKAPWNPKISIPLKDLIENPLQNPAAQPSLLNSMEWNTTNYQQKRDFSEKVSTVGEEKKEYVLESNFWSGVQVLGQANLTYILAQSRNKLFLIDQHAAHERIVFEKLMKGWRDESLEVQDFLIPLVLDFDQEGVEALLGQSTSLQKIGISIDQAGPSSISVRSSPAFLKERGLTAALNKWVQETLAAHGSFAIEKSISDIFATMACHSVIRAGQSMSIEEMKSLLSQMDEFPFSGYCPHGRPAFLEYPFSELDRSFGRTL